MAEVIKVGPLGPYSNNAYVILDRESNRSIVVDAPFESARTIDAARGSDVQMIVLTHRHADHWAEIDLVKEQLGANAWCHEEDRAPYKQKVFDTLPDGAEVALGASKVRIMHTPGHTPGSICLLVDGVLLSGDTLFPGGPGRSDSGEALRQMVRSIEQKLLVLPGETLVYPGHGDNTTIATAQKEHAAFAAKEHDPDLHGDVTWE